jgi:SAM-dependent methyltransferase
MCDAPPPEGTGAMASCPRCGLLWRRQLITAPPEQAWDDEYWSHDTIRRFYRARESAFRDIVSLVAARRPPPGKWLDVGCGVGTLLGLAADQGYEVTGIEASRIAREAALRHVPGSTVHLGVVPEVLESIGSFDVVTLTDVLRSVEDPARTISALASHISEGGLLMVRETDATKRQGGDFKSSAEVGAYAQVFAPDTMRWFCPRVALPEVEILPSPMFIETGCDERGKASWLPAWTKRSIWPLAMAANRLTLGRLVLTPNFLALARRR